MKNDKVYIAVIVGIRAQYMKLAAFQRAITNWNKAYNPKVEPIYINSGQHYDDDLAGIFIKELDIKFNIDFTGTYQEKSPINILGAMIVNLYNALPHRNIDWVIVFGDANTTVAGAIASTKRGLPLVHVEAGVRTGDLNSPEEINRIITDSIANVHFLSSKKDADNLQSEGKKIKAIWTGDLIGDLVAYLSPELTSDVLGFRNEEYILASLHREENVMSDNILTNILTGLNEYSKKVLFIAHPRTRARCKELGFYNNLENVFFVDTLSYKQTLSAIKNSAFLVTDSGAFQREAYYLQKRCLVRQEIPFWKSLIDAGIHRAVGVTKDELSLGFKWIEQALEFKPYPRIDDLGDGNAGIRIIENLVKLTNL